MVWPALIGAAGSIGSGLLGMFGASSANKASARAAQAQMDFQERMSGTAYQRSMADMKKAGLNPMLAYQKGGATTPAGAQPNIRNIMEPLANSAKGLGLQFQTVKNMGLQNQILKEKLIQEGASSAKANVTRKFWDALDGPTTDIKDFLEKSLDGVFGPNSAYDEAQRIRAARGKGKSTTGTGNTKGKQKPLELTVRPKPLKRWDFNDRFQSGYPRVR